ncbi:hypothetical protein KV202_19720, partial [Acinetobacter baumannii]|nr:hypothetical protein [Acinetobacter baumannii]
LLKKYLCTLNFENITNSFEILGNHKVVPNNPDNGGPNYQFFWALLHKPISKGLFHNIIFK